jgi:hypothetical protein
MDFAAAAFLVLPAIGSSISVCLKHHRSRFGACLFAVDVPTLWRPQMRHVSLISVEAMTLEPRRLSLCLQIERKAATSNVLLGQTR